jgi:hypothetical protein
MSIWHSNVRSLNRDKLLALETEVVNEFDILAITETFLNEQSICNLNLEGYHPIFRKDRVNRVGGGVAAYVSESLISTRKTEGHVARNTLICQHFLILCMLQTP